MVKRVQKEELARGKNSRKVKKVAVHMKQKVTKTKFKSVKI